MALDVGLGHVYEEAMVNGNFNFMKQYYTEENSIRLSFDLTTAKDTAFHLAVYSKTEQPLQHLLEIASGDNAFVEPTYKKCNAYGSTALHVAAKIGNYEAVKLLVEYDGSLLEIPDNLGETPLFKAAASGHTGVVVFLASQPGQIYHSLTEKLKKIHRLNRKGAPILHVTIQGGHYGTALKLVELDGTLASEKDASGISSLQLLACFPSAFKSGNPMDLRERILYFVPPIFKYSYNVKRVPSKAGGTETRKNSNSRDIEIGVAYGDHEHQEVWPQMGRLWKEKSKHKFALQLAKILIEKDYSWKQTLSVDPSSHFRPITEEKIAPKPAKEAGERKPGHTSATETPKPVEPPKETLPSKTVEIEATSEDDQNDKNSKQESQVRYEINTPNLGKIPSENPLFTATKNGIVEIVKEILRFSPLAVELYSHNRQNILHIAVLHRQKKIFNMVKKRNISLARLVEGIDEYGYTILHCAADMTHYTGPSRPGPAYQLQDELKWFMRVKKLMPQHFAMHRESRNDNTAKMLFEEQHKDKLKEAQNWVKQTSQSCSTVAVLVATVVYAAAYTVPGGLNESGLPHFLNSPTFSFFTIMDVVSLACSLTAVVMFLSILSSSFEMEDFLSSIPRKLTAGFTLLFLSVITTTLAFASTVLLIIRSPKRQLPATLACTAAFLPVAILELMQFPFYLAFVKSSLNISKVILKVFPFKLVRRSSFD